MSGLPWYKCYPRDFNDGLMGLTMEERGAYVTILNAIYSRGKPVEDDPSYWRAMLQCSGKAWSKVRASLIFKRKLFEVNVDGIPCLMNRRAADEIDQNRKVSEKFSEAGRRGGCKPRVKVNENNDMTKAYPKPRLSDTDTEADKSIEANASCPAKPNVVPKDDTFSEAWKAYPAKGRERSKSQMKTRPIWKEAARQAGGEDALLGAVRRYVREDQTHKGECGPPAFDRWLRDGRWEHWLPDKTNVVAIAEASPELAARRRALLMGE